jgi:hypothetical protein
MSRRRALLLGLVLLLCTAGTLISQPAWAVERYYYTDATFQVECGYRAIHCSFSQWSGCVTDYYYDVYLWPCQGDPEEPSWP